MLRLYCCHYDNKAIGRELWWVCVAVVQNDFGSSDSCFVKCALVRVKKSEFWIVCLGGYFKDAN